MMARVFCVKRDTNNESLAVLMSVRSAVRMSLPAVPARPNSLAFFAGAGQAGRSVKRRLVGRLFLADGAVAGEDQAPDGALQT